MHGLFEGSILNWFLIAFGAFIIGLSKAGLKGIDMLNITIMALVFGSKASTGVVLPLLCIADGLAVLYYHRHAQWAHFWKLLPWMAAGIVVGVVVGKDLNETVFRRVMAVIIVIAVVIVVMLEFRKRPFIPHNRFFVAGTGLAFGVSYHAGKSCRGIFQSLLSCPAYAQKRIHRHGSLGVFGYQFIQVAFSGFGLEEYY
jgi:uncharacterized membrane protein YfcA